MGYRRVHARSSTPRGTTSMPSTWAIISTAWIRSRRICDSWMIEIIVDVFSPQRGRQPTCRRLSPIPRTASLGVFRTRNRFGRWRLRSQRHHFDDTFGTHLAPRPGVVRICVFAFKVRDRRTFAASASCVRWGRPRSVEACVWIRPLVYPIEEKKTKGVSQLRERLRTRCFEGYHYDSSL